MAEPALAFPGWKDRHVRQAMTDAAQASALAAAQRAARPGDPDAQQLALLLSRVCAGLGEVARGRAFTEELLEQERRRAVADYQAVTCSPRLRLLPGAG